MSDCSHGHLRPQASQPEEDHEVHMGSKKTGMEAAAAAAIEQEAAESAAETAAEHSAASQQVT